MFLRGLNYRMNVQLYVLLENRVYIMKKNGNVELRFFSGFTGLIYIYTWNDVPKDRLKYAYRYNPIWTVVKTAKLLKLRICDIFYVNKISKIESEVLKKRWRGNLNISTGQFYINIRNNIWKFHTYWNDSRYM